MLRIVAATLAIVVIAVPLRAESLKVLAAGSLTDAFGPGSPLPRRT